VFRSTLTSYFVVAGHINLCLAVTFAVAQFRPVTVIGCMLSTIDLGEFSDAN
jgi:hypothetical protein